MNADIESLSEYSIELNAYVVALLLWGFRECWDKWRGSPFTDRQHDVVDQALAGWEDVLTPLLRRAHDEAEVAEA